MVPLALELPASNRKIGYGTREVTPRTNVRETRKAFLTHFMAKMCMEYMRDIIWYGREWAPDSFSFRS